MKFQQIFQCFFFYFNQFVMAFCDINVKIITMSIVNWSIFRNLNFWTFIFSFLDHNFHAIACIFIRWVTYVLNDMFILFFFLNFFALVTLVVCSALANCRTIQFGFMVAYTLCVRTKKLFNVLATMHAFKLMDFIRIDSVLVYNVFCLCSTFSLLSSTDRYYINTINTYYIYIICIAYNVNCVQFLNKLCEENEQKKK